MILKMFKVMKIKFLLLLLLTVLFAVNELQAQGLKPPSEGKAAVYFVRPTNMSFGVAFDIFQDSTFLGELKATTYSRFEVLTGEHLIWALGSNVDYMTTNLKAGGIYLVDISVYFGGKLGFTPVTADNAELYKLCMDLINSKPPVETNPDVFVKKKKKHEKIIPEKLKLWHEKYKIDPERKFKHISPEMTVSP
jgi:hypothetical protein